MSADMLAYVRTLSSPVQPHVSSRDDRFAVVVVAVDVVSARLCVCVYVLEHTLVMY